MEAFQLLSDGWMRYRWRLDDLNLFRIVDEEVKPGLATAARRANSMSRPHRPDQRDPPANDGAAEGDIDDEDDPTVRVVAPECHDARHDVDDADNEET